MPVLINMDKSKFRRGISKKLTETESISFYVHHGRWPTQSAGGCRMYQRIQDSLSNIGV
jgi:hypothetical protein